MKTGVENSVKRITKKLGKRMARYVGRQKTESRRLDVRELVEEYKDTGFLGKWTESEETAPENEGQIIHNIKRSFSHMKKVQERVAPEYLPSHSWKSIVDTTSPDFRDFSGDDLAVFFRNFLRGSAVAGIWDDIEIEGSPDYKRAKTMIAQYFAWREEFPDRDIKELDAPRVGNPWGYNFRDFLLCEPVFEYHYQSAYFCRILNGIDCPVILEIGGGFGGLASFILKSLEGVTYIGLDLPENLANQQYYLSSCFPKMKVLFFDESFVELTDKHIDDYDVILLPNFALPHVNVSKIDLIANVRSLSEMSQATIKEYFDRIAATGCKFFFHENIYKPRRDILHGIPSSDFPELKGYTLLSSSVTRWPRYNAASTYPCKENLFIRTDIIA